MAYEAAARDAGHEPGMCLLPPADAPTTVFVADDLDHAWAELGPYLMHDVRSYAEWNEGNTDTASLSFVDTAEELRAENRSHRIFTVDEAIAQVRAGAPLPLHPLIGGAAAGARVALPADRRRRGHARGGGMTGAVQATERPDAEVLGEWLRDALGCPVTRVGVEQLPGGYANGAWRLDVTVGRRPPADGAEGAALAERGVPAGPVP